MEKHIFEELVAAGAVATVSARGVPGGFVLIAQLEGGERMLKTQRGKTRVFAKLDAVAVFLRDLGMTRFNVDVACWARTGLI